MCLAIDSQSAYDLMGSVQKTVHPRALHGQAKVAAQQIIYMEASNNFCLPISTTRHQNSYKTISAYSDRLFRPSKRNFISWTNPFQGTVA
jgi:hypothetical protein